MKFGLLKSQIENMLIESYKNESMKNNMFIFNELVLKNKNISRVFYLYDELNSNKGLNESVAGEFVNQSVIVYENLINKMQQKLNNDSDVSALFESEKMYNGNLLYTLDVDKKIHDSIILDLISFDHSIKQIRA